MLLGRLAQCPCNDLKGQSDVHDEGQGKKARVMMGLTRSKEAPMLPSHSEGRAGPQALYLETHRQEARKQSFLFFSIVRSPLRNVS